MSEKKRASARNRMASASPERRSCGRIHSPDAVIEGHVCYSLDDPRAQQSPPPEAPKKKGRKGRKKSSDSETTNSSIQSSPSPKPARKASKSPKKKKPAKKPVSESEESTTATSSKRSSSKELRNGTTVTTEETINEFVVLPNYEIPRLIMPRYPSQLDLTDSDSDDSFDSDLETHVQNFAPNYNLLNKKDKKYVISTVKHMITQDSVMASATPKGAPYRPKSPEHFKSLSTRCREKEELQDLNERLLVYVNHMRSLKEIEETETHVQIDSELSKVQDSLKALFESELNEARRLLDETANAKAQLELENGRNLDIIAQLRAEISDKEREIAKLLKKIDDLENKLNKANGDNKELKAENKQLQKENDELRKQLENEINNRKQSDKEIVRLERVVTNYENDIIRLKNQLKDFADKEKDLKDEIKSLKKALEDLKDELDKETLKRIDMENKNQTLKEELEFKDSLKDRELSELRREMSSTHRIKIKKKEAAEEFALQLSEALAKAREHFEEEKQALRVQLETVHKQELDAARSYPGTIVRESIEKNKEIIKYSSEIEELKLKIKSLIEREDKLNTTIKKLQQLLDKAEKDLLDADAQHAVDIEKLDKQLKALLKDYSDLMDVKVTLDMEISTYRKLLQAEECRLHLTPSPKSGKVRSALSFGDGEAPSRKRQRVMEESFITETNSHVSIEEVSIEQEYVAVSNMTDKDQSLRGWVLSKKSSGEDSSLDYKFPAKTIVGPGQTVKIYSAGAGATQNPPLSLVFKKLDAWHSPQGIEIELKNKEGDVVSSYKAKAESSTEYLEEEDQRACKLM